MLLPPFLPMSTTVVFVGYYNTMAYRFFRDVHAKHVRTASNMMSRQWSAAECGDCGGRQPVSPTRAYAISGRAVSGFFLFWFSRTVLTFSQSRRRRTDARVSAKNNRKTAASDYITRAPTRTHTTTTTAVVTAASGSSGSSSSSIVVP